MQIVSQNYVLPLPLPLPLQYLSIAGTNALVGGEISWGVK
jgi:hypothetical protein